jgi:hypothetical protein
MLKQRPRWKMTKTIKAEPIRSNAADARLWLAEVSPGTNRTIVQGR